MPPPTTFRTRCTCGATFTAPTQTEVWQQHDQHIDETHGRRFPRQSGVAYCTGQPPRPRRNSRSAPLTAQGGDS